MSKSKKIKVNRGDNRKVAGLPVSKVDQVKKVILSFEGEEFELKEIKK